MKLAPLSSLRRDERGVGFTFLTILAGLFIITFIWMILSGPIGQVVGLFEKESAHAPEGAGETFNMLKACWNYWPWFLVFGYIIYGLLRAQKRGYETGYE